MSPLDQEPAQPQPEQPRQLPPPPVRRGEYYDVTIVDTGKRGDGIAMLGGHGFIVFVPNTTKGDKVKIRIERVSERFAIASKVNL